MSRNFTRQAFVLARLVIIPIFVQAQIPYVLAQVPVRTPLPPTPIPSPTLPPASIACSATGETPGTWCAITTPLDFPGTMLLLTDGRVMAATFGSAGCGPSWQILTPAANGKYGSGTWSSTASMATPRLYFGSSVMQNGQVWVLGGEYSGAACSSSGSLGIIPTGEVYDPVANSWSGLTNYPDTSSCVSFRGSAGEGCFGDDPSALLPGGKILAGDIFTGTPQIWTPTAVTTTPGTWAAAGTKVYSDPSDEEGWAKFPNGNIFVYDLFQSVFTGTHGFAEQYNPTTNTWSDLTPGVNGNTGTLPVMSSSPLGFEMGPPMRLQDGRIFQLGANQHTALYNPTTKVWAAGPDTIGAFTGNPCGTSCAFGSDDAPAAELPNGHVIFAADTSATTATAADGGNDTFTAPTCLFDFNPTTNTTSLMSPQPPNTSDCSASAATNGLSAFPTRMLMLPTGQLLWHDGGQTANVIYLYTPTTTNAAPPYRPVIQNLAVSGTTFTLTGLQLNGQSAGSYYGDDVVTDENYPIVRLINPAGTNTYYAKTTNWSSVAVGSVGQETVNFTLPLTIPAGNYSLIVSGAGLQSAPLGVVITAGEIPSH